MDAQLSARAPAPTPASLEDARLVAAAIARAEQRREMLRELAEMGMVIARELSHRAAHDASPRREPAPHFAAVSRAIRLTLALEARVEEEILALRNGDLASASAAATPPAPVRPTWCDIISKESPDPRRNHIRDEVWEAANQTFEQGAPEWERALMRLHERLNETDAYDHLVCLPWRAAVEAICNDLGLNPDWSGWSDERGLERDPAHWSWDEEEGWIDPEEALERVRRAFEDRHIGANAPSERALE